MSVRLPGCGSSYYCSSILARHGKDDVVVAWNNHSTHGTRNEGNNVHGQAPAAKLKSNRGLDRRYLAVWVVGREQQLFNLPTLTCSYGSAS